MKHFRTLPLKFFFIFLIPISFHGILLGQSNLSQEFLEGLPPSVRDQIDVQNSVLEEGELEELFRADTSLEKNKIILQKLKEQISAIETQLEESEPGKNSGFQLPRFGDTFFQSLQSSFMPINIPNFTDDYVVDVGDEFQVIFTGNIAQELEIPVGRDGSIVIPEFGKVFVAGKTLSEAENMVSAYVNLKSVGVSTFLSLSKVRDMQILMLGGIESPGIFTLSGGSSVLSALNVAGGISEEGSYRNLGGKRAGKTVETIDLYDIFVFGSYDSSNTLRSGDTIFVHPASFLIPVSGGIHYPSLFEMLPGETAADAVSFAGGFSSGFHGFNEVFLQSFGLDGAKKNVIPLTDLESITLNPRDSLKVPSFTNAFDTIKQVSIDGMVQRPGTYYFSEGETLSELVQRAGGYKSGAYTFGGALFRKSAEEQEKIFAQLNYSDTVNYIISNVGKPNRSVDSSALDLLAEELRAQNFSGRVSVNFDKISSNTDKANDIKLEHNDRIVIPSLQKIVYLFGDFKNPSNVTYQSDYSASDYIDMVGGLRDSAYSELLVIDPDGITHVYNAKKLFMKNSSVSIYPGSIIYAPRNIGKLSGVMYASSVSPILSSLALSLASLNSISD